MNVIYGETFITNACDVSIRFLLPSNYLMEFLFCDKYVLIGLFIGCILLFLFDKKSRILNSLLDILLL